MRAEQARIKRDLKQKTEANSSHGIGERKRSLYLGGNTTHCQAQLHPPFGMHCVSTIWVGTIMGGNQQGCHHIVFVAVTSRWNMPSAAQVVFYHRSDTMTFLMLLLNLTFNLWQEKYYHTEPLTMRMEPIWMSRHRAFGETGMSTLSLMYLCSTLLCQAIAGLLSMRPKDVMRISKRAES